MAEYIEREALMRRIDVIVYYCSNPKCRRKTVIKENYCPACGAKMDMEE